MVSSVNHHQIDWALQLNSFPGGHYDPQFTDKTEASVAWGCCSRQESVSGLESGYYILCLFLEFTIPHHPIFLRPYSLRGHGFYCFFFMAFPGIILFFFFFCGGFCHTLKWNSHGFTCVPHPDPPSHLPLHPLPLGFPSAPGPSACLMHPTWAGDLFHPR